MSKARTYRVRDPVHGLIIFESESDEAPRDQLAWKLLNTPEFQRLRRIRQLGVSDFTFPGATHSRFAHSIGVFHTARSLLRLCRKWREKAENRQHKEDKAVLAALLHDVGHGPFSHVFETVQKARKAGKRHEIWTAEIITNPRGNIYPILEEYGQGMANAVADLLTAESPRDEYGAIVSSSFDADRLDYLRRDRLMTGSGAGAIDFDWLLDNIRIANVALAGDNEEGGVNVPTFCLDHKALQAAEAFLLARYHLFEQVYCHKTTRGVESLIRALFSKIAEAAENKKEKSLGLRKEDPLIRFFSAKGQTLENYLALDDFVVWSSIARMASGRGQDEEATDWARRLQERRLYKALDINQLFPILPDESLEDLEGRCQKKIDEIDKRLGNELGKTVFKDTAPINVYGEIGGDEAKRHKKLSILLKDGATREITQLSPAIRALMGKRSIVRYFFKDEAFRDRIREEVVNGVEGHHHGNQ